MIEVTRDEKQHTGPACYRRQANGGTLVLCPYGHLVSSVAPGEWALSIWSTRSSWGEDTVTCHGALPPNARPYRIAGAFLGAHYGRVRA